MARPIIIMLNQFRSISIINIHLIDVCNNTFIDIKLTKHSMDHMELVFVNKGGCKYFILVPKPGTKLGRQYLPGKLSQHKKTLEDILAIEIIDEIIPNDTPTLNEQFIAHNWSTLHLSAYYGNLMKVIYLFNSGEDIEAVTTNGSTPLHIACKGGYILVVMYLVIHCKANIEALDEKGNTPLHIATINANSQVIDFLLEQGANPDIRNKRGALPFNHTSHREIYDLFIYHKKVAKIISGDDDFDD